MQFSLKQWRRSYSNKSANQSSLSSSITTFYTGSNVFNNYTYQALLLFPTGLIGFLIFVTKQFTSIINDNRLNQVVLLAVVSTGPVGLLLFLLALAKTFTR
jgi:hypothetical protein